MGLYFVSSSCRGRSSSLLDFLCSNNFLGFYNCCHFCIGQASCRIFSESCCCIFNHASILICGVLVRDSFCIDGLFLCLCCFLAILGYGCACCLFLDLIRRIDSFFFDGRALTGILFLFSFCHNLCGSCLCIFSGTCTCDRK